MLNSLVEDENWENLMESGRETGLGLLIVKEVGELASIKIKVFQKDVTSLPML